VTGSASNHQLTVGDFNQRNQQAGAVRRYYGEALLQLARQDPRIVALTADLTLSTETDLMRDMLPERFHQVGIAEANMIGMAGGMARSGEVPFVHSFCVFATRRCYDQIAMQVAYPNLNVKIVGVIPGLSTMLGVSHQAIDDIALMRALPNMTIIEPSGPDQVGPAVRAAAAHDGPVYLRLRRADGTEPATPDGPPIVIGQMRPVQPGGDGVILASGMMLSAALEATKILADEGLEVAVIDVPTPKPLDPAIAEIARDAPVVVTVENHSIIGGLGSAVAELLMEAGVRTRFVRVGVRDVFAEGGTTKYLFEKYGLTPQAIVSAFRSAR
jgi:transketolase